MPRKKASSPAPSLSLSGIAITFASYSPTVHSYLEEKTVQQVKGDIAECGGSYTPRIDLCSHFVASQDQYDRKLKRVVDAVANTDVVIVSYDWLVASLKSKTPVSTDGHVLVPAGADSDGDAESDTDTQLPKNPTTPLKRRRQDDDDDDEQDLALTKKAKLCIPAPFPTIGDEAEDDEEDTAIAKQPTINVPVDKFNSKHVEGHRVYVSDNGVPYDATLTYSHSYHNNNKFYRMQLLVNTETNKYHCHCRYGRVGDNGQSRVLGNGTLANAIREFEKKFKEKNGNVWEHRNKPPGPHKYTYIEMNYEASDDEEEQDDDQQPTPQSKRANKVKDVPKIESKLPESVQRLMNLIFNNKLFESIMVDLDYDSKRMPLGKLSKKTLLQGYEVLKELATLIANPAPVSLSYSIDIERKSNKYFSLVPHVVGRKSVPVLSTLGLIKREIELLEALTDMQLANEIMKAANIDKPTKQERLHVIDRQYEKLGLREMTPVKNNTMEYLEILNYLRHSVGNTHGYKYQLEDVFRIERDGEADRLNSSPYAKLGRKSDRRLLWHGSRCTNFGGILSQGLRIAPPEAPSSGYMFGKGVYLADTSSKSAGYCFHTNSGGTALLLLCEAELGADPLRLAHSDYDAGERAKKAGSISTFGMGRTVPQRWKDASCIHQGLKGVKMPDVVTKPAGPSSEPNASLLYNEYIVYDVAQIKLRYLLRVRIN
ncbi:Poly [ADP-ribose] polymerase 2 [Exophiala dermatitidis]